FSPLLRWMGITLVVLTLLQMLAVLSLWQWQEEAFRQLVVERLTNQTPMALVGLLLMYLSARLEGIGETRPPILWTVCILSGLLAVLLTASLPIAFGGDRILTEQAEQQLAVKRNQLEAARQQSKDPALLQQLIRQGEAVGQIPPGVTDQQKQQAARALVDRQLGQLEAQVKQAEQTTRVALNQRRFVSSGGAIVLIVAFTILCLGSVL
ncbi:MAG: HpsJ family protein, partial [Synechococcaceae cyanobacterium]|nr:HpsJ family protein [Synechococcaceae cyanobacterium]